MDKGIHTRQAEVLLVEDAHGEAAEEAGHAVLEHGPARRQEVRLGRQAPAERQEVVLVAARAVEQEERGARSPGNEAVDEAEVRRRFARAHSALPPARAEAAGPRLTSPGPRLTSPLPRPEPGR